jgi:large subunit ribosomal protein L21
MEAFMYAVIESGGKQYRVSEGDLITIETLPYAVGDKVEFDRVLLVSGDSGVTVGQPTVKGAKVVSKVEAVGRGPKIKVFKYRPKERYRRHQGHRQNQMSLRIEKIVQ